MKKTLLFISASVAFATLAQAQTPVITNGSFETWTNVSQIPLITLERPTNWHGSDQLLNHTAGLMLTLQDLDFDYNKQLFKEETDVHEGAVAAKLMTKNFGDTIKVLPVLMTNAKQNPNMSAILAGGISNLDLMTAFRFTEQTAMYGKRIDSVTAYVKTPSTNVEDAAAFVLAYKKITSDSNALIGQGNFSIPTNSGSYVKISIPVTYSAGNATDSMVVGFTSSGLPGATGYTENNTLYVDHVEIFASEASSMKSIARTDLGFQVYPNPAQSHINFNNNNNTAANTLIIQNSVGQIMHYGKMATGNNVVDLSQYAAGTYFYEIYNQAGTARQTGKFVK